MRTRQESCAGHQGYGHMVSHAQVIKVMVTWSLSGHCSSNCKHACVLGDMDLTDVTSTTHILHVHVRCMPPGGCPYVHVEGAT